MTNKERIEKLEKIKPEAKAQVKHFMTSDYASQEELDQAIEKWKLDHPRSKEDPKSIIIEHSLGFKKEIRK